MLTQTYMYNYIHSILAKHYKKTFWWNCVMQVWNSLHKPLQSHLNQTTCLGPRKIWYKADHFSQHLQQASPPFCGYHDDSYCWRNLTGTEDIKWAPVCALKPIISQKKSRKTFWQKTANVMLCCSLLVRGRARMQAMQKIQLTKNVLFKQT